MTENTYITKTSIPQLLKISRPKFEDERGAFSEVFRLKDLESESGYEFRVKQVNYSYSKPKVLRGFHAEEWSKLIYITSGKILCVFVDIREENFLKVEKIELDAKNCEAVFVPQGVANSFLVLGEEGVNYIYLNDDYYKGPNKRAFIWNDPTLNIEWPVSDPIISEADLKNPTLKEVFPEKVK
jgi:dTDP-4-dehydrorhamnose 3,5-epimerase